MDALFLEVDFISAEHRPIRIGTLRQVWIGEDRLSRLYPAVNADDVPFAQDCFGDQFLLVPDLF